MGDARRRNSGVGVCIYCGAAGPLSDEHIIPLGLGGDLVLKRASCADCANTTSLLELRLLRGQWWSYRQLLNLPTRRPKRPVPDLPVKVNHADGTTLDAFIPRVQQPMVATFKFDPPSILRGLVSETEPCAAGPVLMRMIAEVPREVIAGGTPRALSGTDKIEVPINFDAGEFCRFLAKVAHGYAVHSRGLQACKQWFLPRFILGETRGAQTYVGGAASPFVHPLLPGSRIHALVDRINGPYLTVYVQLFRERGEPPPIYEIVVGTV